VRVLRMFSGDLEGHAPSWRYSALVTRRPSAEALRTRPQPDPP